MATKKKSKKTKKSTRTSGKKPKAKRAVTKATPKKRAAAQKKATSSRKASSTASSSRGNVSRTSRSRRSSKAEMENGSLSAGQSGDLQGLRDTEGADSESVNELLEEGNAFEAGVVDGVERADDHDGQEVHTHEVSEDDVPEEYLDKD